MGCRKRGSGAAHLPDVSAALEHGRQLQIYEGLPGVGRGATARPGRDTDVGGLGVGSGRVFVSAGSELGMGGRAGDRQTGRLGATSRLATWQADPDARIAPHPGYADHECGLAAIVSRMSRSSRSRDVPPRLATRSGVMKWMSIATS